MREIKRIPAPLLVALGISASRLAGLGRETVASRLLGNSAAADAFAVAMRIPNLLQNLLGEGVLSASFVPVYSRLLGPAEASGDSGDSGDSDDSGAASGVHDTNTRTGEAEPHGHPGSSDLHNGSKASAGHGHRGDCQDPGNSVPCDGSIEASRVAGAVAGLLVTVTGLGMLVLVTLARPITFLLAPGLSAQRFDLAVSLTRITTVGVGFAVMSAWCLSVLNSHRKFFLSYVAPVLWNAAQVGALAVAWILAFDIDGMARALAWGVSVGGIAQTMLQLPTTLRLVRGMRLGWGRGLASVREVRRRFVPAVLGRGVVQITSYIDLMLASLLATGAVAALFRAQILYMLPISLFAMSVAAAELPEMSRLVSDRTALQARAVAAARKVAFWMLFAAAAYAAVGDLVVELLFEGGLFSSTDTALVWLTVVVYGLGLPATGVSRVLHNTFYALGDAVTPAWIAATRVVVATAVGAAVMFPLDRVIVASDGSLLELAADVLDALRPAWVLPAAERELADTVRLGAVGLAVGSAVAAWVEIVLLSLLLRKMLGGMRVRVGSILVSPAAAAAVAFCTALALKTMLQAWPTVLAAPLVLSAAVVAYTSVAWRCGVDEASMLLHAAGRIIPRLHGRA